MPKCIMLNRISHIQKNTQCMIKFMTSWGKKKENYRKRKQILVAKRWKYKEGLTTEFHKNVLV